MKVMFASPYCLLDPSSGASISCRSMLEGLAARGHETRAVSATIFDRPRCPTSAEFLQKVGARQLSSWSAQRVNVWGIMREEVKYLISPSKAQRRPNLTCAEALAYQRLVMESVKRDRPDVVMAYGGKPIDRDIYRWLSEIGIPVVFYLANPNYGDRRSFLDIDVIVTDTQATAKLYKERLGVDVVPIGKVIKPFPMAPGSPRDCITFINPAPEKGASVVVGIMQEMLRRGVKARFLVVESRRGLDQALPALGVTRAELGKVECLPMQSDMRQVWRRTRVLLHPSLWHESGPRSVLEACSASIPVLATDSGGIRELLGDGGFLLPIPSEVAKDYAKPVLARTAEAWCDVLEPLLTDEAFYEKASERAVQRWQDWSAHDALGKLEALMKGAIAKRQQRRAQRLAQKLGSADESPIEMIEAAEV